MNEIVGAPGLVVVSLMRTGRLLPPLLPLTHDRKVLSGTARYAAASGIVYNGGAGVSIVEYLTS